jgi:hypothetical protein
MKSVISAKSSLRSVLDDWLLVDIDALEDGGSSYSSVEASVMDGERRG